MDVSTREARSDASLASGVRSALGGAVWLAPLLLPVALLQALLVAAPWFDSLEATSQGSLLASAADWRTRELVQLGMVAAGGVPGFAAVALLVTLAWLVVLRARGPLKKHPHVTVPKGAQRHRLHAMHLLAWLLGAAGCLLVQYAGFGLDRLVDAVTSLRPTGAASLALLAASQSVGFVATGAILGATLALSRCVQEPRARAGAAAVVVALTVATLALDVTATAALAARFDARARLTDTLGTAGVPEPLSAVVVARDRTWVLPMHDGFAEARFSPEAAARAEALLDARQGWTLLADDVQRFVVGERLVALDPGGARAAALRNVLRYGAPASSHALLVALASSAPSDQARREIDLLESSPVVRLGPDGLHLVAAAHARLGDRPRAESALARLRSIGGEAWVISSRNALPLELTTFTEGRVSGRLVVDGTPWRGRVGLVSTRALFTLPSAGEEVQVTWLLRLLTAVPADAEGRFEFTGLPAGEMALVLLMPGLPPRRSVAHGEIQRIEASPEVPEIDLGVVSLSTGVEPPAGKVR